MVSHVANTAPESLPSAIELMTAWLECSDDSPGPLIARLRDIISERPADGDQLAAAVELIMGMTYLSGSLLCLLERESGLPARATLQELALQHAQG